MGVSRVILGSVAVKDPQLVKDACKNMAVNALL